MSEVRFPNYRNYEAARVVVNNAMNALLVGSRLGEHLLANTMGSTELLSARFPAIEHIRRFDVRVDTARDMLAGADHHFASVAIPYALSAHEEFVQSCLDMLETAGVALITHGKRIQAWNMHTVLFETTGYSEPSRDLDAFHLLREMRNSIVHAAGRVEQRLQNQVATTSPAAIAEWEKLTGTQPAALVACDRLELAASHAFAAFAITKRLGREVNDAMQVGLPRIAWVALAVDDFSAGARHARNSAQWRRALWGYTNRTYGALHINDNELETAARASGAWTRVQWL